MSLHSGPRLHQAGSCRLYCVPPPSCCHQNRKTNLIVSCTKPALTGNGINSKLIKSKIIPSVVKTQQRRESQTLCAASSDSHPHPDKIDEKRHFYKHATLISLFALWYLANVYFNIYNKQVLRTFPYPYTCTLFQFFVGSILSISMAVVGIVKVPHFSPTLVSNVAPLTVVHTLGNLLTNISLGSVAVSFTHTIKAMEPFFSVVLSSLFLGDKPNLPVMLTLIPIVGGVVAASLTEASFTWIGFASAMASNVTFQSRNVLSKKLMHASHHHGPAPPSPPPPSSSSSHASSSSSSSAAPASAAAVHHPQKLDNISLFSLITVASFFLLLPITILKEGVRFTPAALLRMGFAPDQLRPLYLSLALSGLSFHLYQQVSYMILQRVTPVSHSIGNCVKRIVIIVSSVIVFKNPVSVQNACGTAIALLGVMAYTRVKPGKKKK